MAKAIDDPARRRYCLEQVLRINPANETAQRVLAGFQPERAEAEEAAQPEPQPEPERQFDSARSAELAAQAQQNVQIGYMVQARKLAGEAIKADPHNEEAWQALYASATGKDSRLKVVKKWLEANPDSRQARGLLDSLQAKPKDRMSGCVWFMPLVGLVALLFLFCTVKVALDRGKAMMEAIKDSQVTLPVDAMDFPSTMPPELEAPGSQLPIPKVEFPPQNQSLFRRYSRPKGQPAPKVRPTEICYAPG